MHGESFPPHASADCSRHNPAHASAFPPLCTMAATLAIAMVAIGLVATNQFDRGAGDGATHLM
jgi:hypothetical protein